LAVLRSTEPSRTFPCKAPVPVGPSVAGACEILGLDPLYVANEGKWLVIVSKEDDETVLRTMKKNNYGKGSIIMWVK
jgi:hydrogenase expression/formation protein HypE